MSGVDVGVRLGLFVAGDQEVDGGMSTLYGVDYGEILLLLESTV